MATGKDPLHVGRRYEPSEPPAAAVGPHMLSSSKSQVDDDIHRRDNDEVRCSTEAFDSPSQLEKNLQSSEGDTKEDQTNSDVIWVEFGVNDPQNPFNFSPARKWTTTLLAIFFTAEVAATAGA